MKVHVAQIYISVGVNFPFTHHFQKRISDAITSLVVSSAKFCKKYAEDFELMFRMSAKVGMEDNEIRGPTVFRKTKDVEYTIFLPFDVINTASDVPRTALQYLLNGICVVLESLDIDTAKIVKQQDALIKEICSDPIMFESAENNE